MTTETPAENDMLKRIFSMQSDLNDYVFKKNSLKDTSGNPLAMDTIFAEVNQGDLKVNDLPNVWLSNYSRAMREEILELDEELLWKWWSKDEIDIQNIRVELIDILHFSRLRADMLGPYPGKKCTTFIPRNMRST